MGQMSPHFLILGRTLRSLNKWYFETSMNDQKTVLIGLWSGNMLIGKSLAEI